MATKTKKATSKSIELTAQEYQDITRQIKELEASQKSRKEDLITYAKENPQLLDDSFQVKFKNGTYVALRTSDKLSASDAAKQLLIDSLDEEYVLVSLNEKAIIAAAQKNDRFMKRVISAGATLEQKETYAVYAN